VLTIAAADRHVEHLRDPDAVGRIAPEVAAALSAPLRARLREVRATE
jgi:hypothetical protein